ncbi:alpha/beta hydrolase family protein [Caenimonas aquaedulcis]|uniref:S9 family peptidase n=1 Tax=Caenimonas aquaedulcis TaxID=2793270 RepID=A0A931H146_9BURK|nr:alpha/beta fold hydrolase [Caenimonas aquaedulcis]MBG9386637.1 S9 family peptidase [Caenimonas aquaedulcis]
MNFKLVRRTLLCAFSVLAWALALPPHAGAQPASRPPIEAFFQNPAFAGGEMSPTGAHVALLVASKTTGRIQLVVVDTAKFTAKAIASYTDGDINSVHWISDKRLVYSVYDFKAGIGERANYVSPGLFAVDFDGTGDKQLARLDWGMERSVGDRQLMDPTTRFVAATNNVNSDDIFVTQARFSDTTHELEALTLYRLNTRTGIASPYNRPGKSTAWYMDAKDVPRATVTEEAGRGAVYYLDPEKNQWTKLVEYDAVTGEDRMTPIGFAPDGSLFVRQQRGAAGTSALYQYDFKARAVDPAPVVGVAGHDFRGQLLSDGKRLLGIRYVSDAEATAWFDPELKQLQATIDKALPGAVNRLDVPDRAETPVVLVQSFSDANPGTYYIYNRQTGKFTELGQVMPGIDAKQMGQRDFVRYKARDGLDIPAWLTLPPGAKGRKLPLVVLVHGGPYIGASSWEWKAESQFLATRGYAVLEPDFRGTRGYGMRHFRAGWKQWGLAMQHDLADGARWAVDKGIAEPSRICIAGASYGGYATLMGLVNDPDLYRCGVEWAGVTDIDLMYSVTWSDFGSEFKTYGMPVLVGDREKDAEQLKATSPLLQASRIKQPLLMAYGGADRRVPIVHGVRFRDAVQKTNPAVEWIEYTDEGHGWLNPKTRVDFWSRVEKFLDKNIGAKP